MKVVICTRDSTKVLKASLSLVLGRDATKAFMNEDYHECLPILQQLAEKRPNDARVLTNLAVCKFYAA